MVENFINNNDKLELRQIVLQHLKRILEISSHELRDSSKQIISAHYTDMVDQEDTRLSYIQAIENLAYVLIPYFDEIIKGKYEECIEVINSYKYQLAKRFEKEISEIKKEIKIEENIPDNFYINLKITYAKKLFVELNLLLKRNDYLKGSVYGEGEDNEASEGDK